ncbi:hypothetical protein ACQ4PT_063007 [Festuca glaucescens]
MESDAIIIRRRVMSGGVDRNGARGNQSVALDHIHDYYKKALHRLPPELIPSLLEAGFCFGFLDPVSNIIANTVSHELGKGRETNTVSDELGNVMEANTVSDELGNVMEAKTVSHELGKGREANTVSHELGKGRETKKRSRAGKEKKGDKSESRRTAISKIITESSKSIRLVPRTSDSSNTVLRNSSIAARSLRGLVTFLTSYFRYLTTWDALHYLSLSNADLLVTVHLIQEVRGTHTFTIQDPTAKIALGCAAISALHPAPAVATLMSRSFLLASLVDEASNLLEAQSISHSIMQRLSELLTSPRDMTNRGSPVQQAITRLQHMKMKAITRLQQRKMEPPVGAGLEISLKMVLLDKIHLLYLEAISCIPKDDLHSRHHRGLLKAGYCYGPCDPVTNIILNTIWYDTVFPPKQHFEVAMICTKSLVRIEYLSLCGLVAYICVRFPGFSVYEAMRRLLICNASLDSVIKMAKKERHDEDILFSESVAYDIASRAAHHPRPAALAKFATTMMPRVGRTLGLTREVKRGLSSIDVSTICRTLSRELLSKKSSKKVQNLSSRATKIISANLDEFKACQDTIVKMVEAALCRYAEQQGQEYELHVICGVNSTIPEYGVFYSYPFSHMNILARRRGSQNDDADQVPTLFFIQCSNGDEEMQHKEFLCCPIFDLTKDAGRCYHCEYDGIKIIHPSSESYIGRCEDFEDMARGESSVNIQGLVGHGQRKTLFDGTLEYEDSIYFDPSWDVDFSKFINRTAREQARKEKLRKEQHPGSLDHSWRDKLVYKESLACRA